jgi:predicted MFS family arabinose efflux permease
LLWLFLKPVNYKPLHTASIGQPKTQSAYKDKTYLYFAFITMLFASCFFQLFTNLPVYFKKELHFSELFIGFLMSANGIIIALVEMVLIYKLEAKQKNAFYITIGVLLVGLSFLLLNIPVAAVVVASSMIVMVTFGEILSMPFMNSYWIARTQPSNRGQYAALYTMAWSAAQTLGPMGGAQLAEHAGFNVLWWAVGGLSILASLSFWKLLRKS